MRGSRIYLRYRAQHPTTAYPEAVATWCLTFPNLILGRSKWRRGDNRNARGRRRSAHGRNRAYGPSSGRRPPGSERSSQLAASGRVGGQRRARGGGSRLRRDGAAAAYRRTLDVSTFNFRPLFHHRRQGGGLHHLLPYPPAPAGPRPSQGLLSLGPHVLSFSRELPSSHHSPSPMSSRMRILCIHMARP